MAPPSSESNKLAPLAPEVIKLSFQILDLLGQIGELAKQAWPLVATSLRLTEGTEEMALEPSK
jgi:hypothetical protein